MISKTRNAYAIAIDAVRNAHAVWLRANDKAINAQIAYDATIIAQSAASRAYLADLQFDNATKAS